MRTARGSLTGDRIRAARLLAGMTQNQLAELVGVSARTIGNYERGETIPDRTGPRLVIALGQHLEPDYGPTLRSATDEQLVAEVAARLRG